MQVQIWPTLSKNDESYATYLTKGYLNPFFLDAVTEKELEIEISQLKENKSCEYDGIPPKVVQKISRYIVHRLTSIFNKSFQSGMIPEQLKVALITPIFKENNKENFANFYRPLSAP